MGGHYGKHMSSTPSRVKGRSGDMKKSAYVFGIIGLLIGIVLGYSLSILAPELSAQVFPGFTVRGGNPFNRAQVMLPAQSDVEQCKQNCDQQTISNPIGPRFESCRGPLFSDLSYPFRPLRCGGYCTRNSFPYPLSATRGTYTCNMKSCAKPSFDTNSPAEHGFVLAPDPNNSRGEAWVKNCDK